MILIISISVSLSLFPEKVYDPIPRLQKKPNYIWAWVTGLIWDQRRNEINTLWSVIEDEVFRIQRKIPKKKEIDDQDICQSLSFLNSLMTQFQDSTKITDNISAAVTGLVWDQRRKEINMLLSVIDDFFLKIQEKYKSK